MINNLKRYKEKIDYIITEKKRISLRILFVVIVMSIISTVVYLPEGSTIEKIIVILYSLFIPMLILLIIFLEINISDDEKYNFLFRKKINYQINTKYAERWYSIRPLFLVVIIIISLSFLILIIQKGQGFFEYVDSFVQEIILKEILLNQTYSNLLNIISIFSAVLFSGIFVQRASLFYVDGETKIQRNFLKWILLTAICLLVYQIVFYIDVSLSAYVFCLFFVSFFMSCVCFISKVMVKDYYEDFLIIKKIDHICWQKNYIFLPNRFWNDSIIEKLFCEQLEYRNRNKYWEQFKRIKNVEFHSAFYDCAINRKLALKKKRQIIIWLFVLDVSVIGNVLGYTIPDCWFFIIMLFLFQWISAVLIILILEKNHFMGYNKFIISSWGYYINEINNHTYFTNTYERKRTLIKEYKKIICLWNVIFQMKKRDKNYSIERIFDIWVEHLKEQIHYYGETAKVCVTPFIVCLCLSNLHDDVSNKYLLPVHQMMLSKHEKHIISEMSLALIRDLYGDDNEYEKESIHYMHVIDRYLEI